jgi:hypothetical protein
MIQDSYALQVLLTCTNSQTLQGKSIIVHRHCQGSVLVHMISDT